MRGKQHNCTEALRFRDIYFPQLWDRQHHPFLKINKHRILEIEPQIILQEDQVVLTLKLPVQAEY